MCTARSQLAVLKNSVQVLSRVSRGGILTHSLPAFCCLDALERQPVAETACLFLSPSSGCRFFLFPVNPLSLTFTVLQAPFVLTLTLISLLSVASVSQ